MSDIERFIEQKGIYADKAYERLNYRQTLKVISADDLREFVEGKVLVDAAHLKTVLNMTLSHLDMDAQQRASFRHVLSVLPLSTSAGDNP